MQNVIKQYFKGCSKIGIPKALPKFLRNNPEVESYLNKLLTENPNWENTRNIVYGICFDEQLKHCKNCGKEMKYSQGIKHDYCSYKCRSSSNEVRENYKQTCIERFGCENPAQSEKIKNKVKQTCLEKYGCENPFQNENIKNKIKQTNLERYSCENPLQNKKIREKVKQTNLEKYSCENPFQNKEIREKYKQTCIERFGCENPAQSEKIKNKVKQTCLERFGCENPSQSEEIQKKVKQTCLERYGCEHVLQNKEFQKKVKQTCLERFGCEYASQSEEIQKKVKQTCLERFGCENPAQSKEIQEKYKQTCIEKYGCINPFQNEEVQEKVKQILHNKSYDYLIPKFIEHGITPLFPKEEYTGRDKTYKWKCKCGNEFEQKIRATGHVEECPLLPRCWNCYPRLSGESKSELELFDFVKEFAPNAHQHDKVIIKPYELDIVIDELKLAIEYNGDYWHSAEFHLEHHDNLDGYYNYHLNKVLETNKKGYRLIHIWENELDEIEDKLKDILEGKENLNFTEDTIKLDRSWYNNIEIPGYKLVEELPPEIVNRNGFNVENCGYLVYKRIN